MKNPHQNYHSHHINGNGYTNGSGHTNRNGHTHGNGHSHGNGIGMPDTPRYVEFACKHMILSRILSIEFSALLCLEGNIDKSLGIEHGTVGGDGKQALNRWSTQITKGMYTSRRSSKQPLTTSFPSRP